MRLFFTRYRCACCPCASARTGSDQSAGGASRKATDQRSKT